MKAYTARAEVAFDVLVPDEHTEEDVETAYLSAFEGWVNDGQSPQRGDISIQRDPAGDTEEDD